MHFVLMEYCCMQLTVIGQKSHSYRKFDAPYIHKLHLSTYKCVCKVIGVDAWYRCLLSACLWCSDREHWGPILRPTVCWTVSPWPIALSAISQRFIYRPISIGPKDVFFAPWILLTFLVAVPPPLQYQLSYGDCLEEDGNNRIVLCY